MCTSFVENEWLDLCCRLRTSAQYIAGAQADLAREFEQQAASFSAEATPGDYSKLLTRVADAARLAKSWQDQRSRREGGGVKAVPVEERVNTSDAIVDEVGDDSFPASDPPAWTSSALS